MMLFGLSTQRSAVCLTCFTIAMCVPRCVCSQETVRPDPETIRANVEGLERERQEHARVELERLRNRRIDLVSKVEYARRWVLSNYEFDIYSVIREPRAEQMVFESPVLQARKREREQIASATQQRVGRKGKREKEAEKLTPMELRMEVLKRVEDQRVLRDAFLARLLDPHDGLEGTITQGRALNFLLEKLGAVAFDHALYRQLTAQRTLAETNHLSSLLDQGSAGELKLDQSVTRHIRYLRGTGVIQETGRLNDGPLDLEWPAFLRKPDFISQREAIVSARDEALTELRADGPISNQTADDLLAAVKALQSKVRAARPENVGGIPAQELWSWVLASRHSKLLMEGAYRLIEAAGSEDILVDTFDQGSIEDLMAFMYRHKLNFAPADANGEVAYRTIADLMLRYYADVEALRAAVAEIGDNHVQEALLAEFSLGPPSEGADEPRLGAEGARAMLQELGETNAEQRSTPSNVK